jgi:hypothetical protein
VFVTVVVLMYVSLFRGDTATVFFGYAEAVQTPIKVKTVPVAPVDPRGP